MRVDKTKWEISSFVDCVQTVKVKDAIQKKDYLYKGNYPIVSQEKEFISGYSNVKSNLNEGLGKLILFGDHTRVLKFIDFDFCIGADGVKVLRPIESLKPKYLYYYLKWSDIPSNGYSRHFKYLKEIDINIPSLHEQQGIATELDSIQTMIDGYKAQIADLEELAKSIFLDMFGDPIENEKGWDTCKIIEVVKMQRGFDLPVQCRNNSGKIPIYGSNGIVGMHNSSKIEFGIITGRSGTLGEVYTSHVPFWPLNTTLFSVETHGNNIIYLKYLLSFFHLERFKGGAGVPTLNRNTFHNKLIPNIPLPLQQQFATQIESIEKQKELYKSQLKDAEQLMSERMQYYFS